MKHKQPRPGFLTRVTNSISSFNNRYAKSGTILFAAGTMKPKTYYVCTIK